MARPDWSVRLHDPRFMLQGRCRVAPSSQRDPDVFAKLHAEAEEIGVLAVSQAGSLKDQMDVQSAQNTILTRKPVIRPEVQQSFPTDEAFCVGSPTNHRRVLLQT